MYLENDDRPKWDTTFVAVSLDCVAVGSFGPVPHVQRDAREEVRGIRDKTVGRKGNWLCTDMWPESH